MTYRGQIKNGVVVFDEPITLAEGTSVEVVVPEIDDETFPTLYERLKNVIGIAEGLPPDMAENHDHYAHGKPK